MVGKKRRHREKDWGSGSLFGGKGTRRKGSPGSQGENKLHEGMTVSSRSGRGNQEFTVGFRNGVVCDLAVLSPGRRRLN